MTFITDKTRNTPTPAPTTPISTQPFTICETWPASTDRSGSATVITTPMAKQTASRRSGFPDLDRPVPTCSPIGDIATSAPSVKSPIPITSSRAETRNTPISVPVKDTHGVRYIISTMTTTGITENAASLIFPSNALKTILRSIYKTFYKPSGRIKPPPSANLSRKRPSPSRT